MALRSVIQLKYPYVSPEQGHEFHLISGEFDASRNEDGDVVYIAQTLYGTLIVPQDNIVLVLLVADGVDLIDNEHCRQVN